VISAPVHVQDYPARTSPQMGFEGANVIFDDWVHPLMMGLEEHLLGMFREDFEFNDDAVPSHLAMHGETGRASSRNQKKPKRAKPTTRPRSSGSRTPSRSFARSRFSSVAKPSATPRPSLRKKVCHR